MPPDPGEHDRGRIAAATKREGQPVRDTYFAARQSLEKSAQVVPRSAPLSFMLRHCIAQLWIRARSSTWFVGGRSGGASSGVDAAGGWAAGANWLGRGGGRGGSADCMASRRPAMVLWARTGAEMPARRTATARVRNGPGIILVLQSSCPPGALQAGSRWAGEKAMRGGHFARPACADYQRGRLLQRIGASAGCTTVRPAVIDHVRTCVAGSWAAGTPAGDMATFTRALAAWKIDKVIEHHVSEIADDDELGKTSAPGVTDGGALGAVGLLPGAPLIAVRLRCEWPLHPPQRVISAVA